MFRQQVLHEILDERAVSSRNQRKPRGVKRKMSNYPLRPRNALSTKVVNIDAAIKVLFK